MGPIHNASTGDCNDSIKPGFSVSCSWMVYWSGPGKGEGRAGGWKRDTHTHTHTHTLSLSSLIYFRSVLMSSRPRPQQLSAHDLAPVLMKKRGNSIEVEWRYTHTHTKSKLGVCANPQMQLHRYTIQCSIYYSKCRSVKRLWVNIDENGMSDSTEETRDRIFSSNYWGSIRVWLPWYRDWDVTVHQY